MLAFDTLEYTKTLVQAGVPQEQAEAHAATIKLLVENDLATKRDLKELEVTLRHEIKELEVTLRHELKEMELRSKGEIAGVKGEIAGVKGEIIKWVAGMLLAQTGIIAALVKLL